MVETFHVAIIPDGNRRWARQHGVKGYKELYDRGIEGMLDVAEEAFECGVTHLSLWGSSHANATSRSSDFITNIDRVFRDNIHRFANHQIIEKYGIRINVIGEWHDSMTSKTVEAMEDAIAKTAHHSERELTLLIDYSGVRERTAAIQSVLANPKSDMSAELLLRSRSWTGHLPDLDLIIRTGSWKDPHNSAGFMSLLADEVQYAFPEVLWPDFTSSQLQTVIDDFRDRERRLGK